MQHVTLTGTVLGRIEDLSADEIVKFQPTDVPPESDADTVWSGVVSEFLQRAYVISTRAKDSLNKGNLKAKEVLMESYYANLFDSELGYFLLQQNVADRLSDLEVSICPGWFIVVEKKVDVVVESGETDSCGSTSKKWVKPEDMDLLAEAINRSVPPPPKPLSSGMGKFTRIPSGSASSVVPNAPAFGEDG